MKKLLSLVLAFVMVTSVLAGCGKKETPIVAPGAVETPGKTDGKETPDKEEVTNEVVPEEGARLVVWETGDSPEQTFIEYSIAEFQKIYPNVQFDFQPVAPTDAADKIALDGPNGEGADIFVAPHDHLGRLVVNGLVLENDTFNAGDFFEAAVSAATYEGVVYGYPLAIETYALFYNKDLVAEPAKTFEEIVELAKTFNDPGSNRYAFMFQAMDPYYIYAFLGGYGAKLFGPNGDDKNILGFDSQAGIDAMKYYQSLRKSVYDVNAEDATWDPMMASFTSGNAAYMINGPWGIDPLKNSGINFGVVELPLLPNGERPTSFSGVRETFVSAFTQYPNAAKLFAEFMSSREMLLKRFEITNQIPARTDIQVSDEYINGILAQAEYAVPMPSIPEMSAYWTVMGGAYANIWNGADVEAELESAAAAMRENINK